MVSMCSFGFGFFLLLRKILIGRLKLEATVWLLCALTFHLFLLMLPECCGCRCVHGAQLQGISLLRTQKLWISMRLCLCWFFFFFFSSVYVYITYVLCFGLFSFETVSGDPSWPWTHDSPVSTFWVLRFHVCMYHHTLFCVFVNCYK